MTDVYTAALLPTKPSSDDDSGFRHGFGAEASLPLTRNAPAVTYDTTRRHSMGLLVRTLSWIFLRYFPLSNGESPRLVNNTGIELIMKPGPPTSVGNALVIQPFQTHYYRRCPYFSN